MDAVSDVRMLSVCIQDEVLVNVDVNKPGLYRIIYRYVNPTNDDVVADVTVTPEASGDVTQSSHVTFEPTAGARPQFTSVSTGSIVTTFVLNPGPLSVALKSSPGVLVVSHNVGNISHRRRRHSHRHSRFCLFRC